MCIVFTRLSLATTNGNETTHSNAHFDDFFVCSLVSPLSATWENKYINRIWRVSMRCSYGTVEVSHFFISYTAAAEYVTGINMSRTNMFSENHFACSFLAVVYGASETGRQRDGGRKYCDQLNESNQMVRICIGACYRFQNFTAEPRAMKT